MGDSVAVNGVCLTATETSRKAFHAQAMGETLARSTLGDLGRGARVNLELPARLSDRLGGHLVQGHVDGVAEVVRIEDDDGARRLWFRVDEDLLALHGSEGLDHSRRCVADDRRCRSDDLPGRDHPAHAGSDDVRSIAVGSTVNVEVDVIAKYVKRFVERT